MKKLFSVFLIAILLIPCASADDLSGLSFDDLLKLRQEITSEIISRPEWREVTVPEGEYIIGEDIPAGSYSIDGQGNSFVVDTYKNKERKGHNYFVVARGEIIGKIELSEGMLIILSEKCVFAPPKGLDF